MIMLKKCIAIIVAVFMLFSTAAAESNNTEAEKTQKEKILDAVSAFVNLGETKGTRLLTGDEMSLKNPMYTGDMYLYNYTDYKGDYCAYLFKYEKFITEHDELANFGVTEYQLRHMKDPAIYVIDILYCSDNPENNELLIMKNFMQTNYNQTLAADPTDVNPYFTTGLLTNCRPDRVYLLVENYKKMDLLFYFIQYASPKKLVYFAADYPMM